MMLVMFGLAVMSAAVANADLIGTYVDATSSNLAPGSAITSANDDYDNLWCELDLSLVNPGGDVHDLSAYYGEATSEDCPELTMTVSGLANGTYSVYGVYWAKEDWNINMGLTSGSLSNYNKDNGTATGNYREADLLEYQALLGQVTVTDGSFRVYVDDSDSGGRSWFDGVTYVPEPATMVLLAAGGLALLRRRSR